MKKIFFTLVLCCISAILIGQNIVIGKGLYIDGNGRLTKKLTTNYLLSDTNYSYIFDTDSGYNIQGKRVITYDMNGFANRLLVGGRTDGLIYYPTGFNVIGLGYDAAGQSTGNTIIAIGSDAMWMSSARHTIGIGENAMAYGCSADSAIGIGNNVGLGSTGKGSIYIGNLTGATASGEYTIGIGDSAARNNTLDNRLYIGAGDSTSALIYGQHRINKHLRINGNLTVSNGLISTMNINTVDSTMTLIGILKLTPQINPPASVTEGMIYADTDHHLYYYDGSAWKQLDN